MTIVDDELAARRGTSEEEATGVVTDDAADDTPEQDEPEATVEEPRPTPPMQIPLPGGWSGLNDVAGGTQPTSSEARLLGGAMPIEGQFAGEERVTLVVEAVVSEVHVVYTTDDWGQTKAVKRRHRMRMLSVRKMGE